jgi:hypothetical protein
MVMALGAITFSALTLAFDRSHHRKSVRPFCNIHQDVTNTEICISVENAGMGPMLIQSILLLKNYDDPVQTGIPLTKEMFSEFECDVFEMNTGKYVLAPLCKLNLFQSTAGISYDGLMTKLKDKVDRCCLYVKYTDVYDDAYEEKVILDL